MRFCCTNPVRDSSRESSVVAGLHQQKHAPELQDQELDSRQTSAEAAGLVEYSVRSRGELGNHADRQVWSPAGLQR